MLHASTRHHDDEIYSASTTSKDEYATLMRAHRPSSVPFRRTTVIAGLDWTCFWANS
jgi:hypothetical protein